MNNITKIVAILIAFALTSNVYAWGQKSEPGEEGTYTIEALSMATEGWAACGGEGYSSREGTAHVSEYGKVSKPGKATQDTRYRLSLRSRGKCEYIDGQNVTGMRSNRNRFHMNSGPNSRYRGSYNRGRNDFGNEWARGSRMDRNDRVIHRGDGVRYSARAGGVYVPGN